MERKILQAMREEGAVMREALAAEIHAETKTSARDLVTNYDCLVQAHLEEKLHQILPQAGFLGEEGLRVSPTGEGGRVFIIDPIDCTMNFSRGYRRSSISVALAEGDQVVFGAVYDPYLDQMFWAKRGGGAFLNDAPIHVSDRPMEEALIMFGTSSYYRAIADRTLPLAGPCLSVGWICGAAVPRPLTSAVWQRVGRRSSMSFCCRPGIMQQPV